MTMMIAFGYKLNYVLPDMQRKAFLSISGTYGAESNDCVVP